MALHRVTNCWLHPDQVSVFVERDDTEYELGDILVTPTGVHTIVYTRGGWSSGDREFVKLTLRKGPAWLRR